jgi:hypothetical protein
VKAEGGNTAAEEIRWGNELFSYHLRFILINITMFDADDQYDGGASTVIKDNVDVKRFYFSASMLPFAEKGAVTEIPAEDAGRVGGSEDLLPARKDAEHGDLLGVDGRGDSGGRSGLGGRRRLQMEESRLPRRSGGR